MADPGRNARVQPRRGARDAVVGFGDREPRRRQRRGPVAVGDGEDRAVIGERAGRRHQPVGVRGGAQALEPAGGHDGVGVDDHDVGRRGVAEDRVHVRDEAEVLGAAHVLHGQPLGDLLGDAPRERLDLRVRARVVGDEHVRAGRRVLDDAAQALLEQVARPEHGDADDRLAAAHASSPDRRSSSESFASASMPLRRASAIPSRARRSCSSSSSMRCACSSSAFSTRPLRSRWWNV